MLETSLLVARTMGNMSDLEVQKRLWGRDGHGIPGANPNYAGRAGIGALVIVIILIVAFVSVTDHTPKMPDPVYFDQYNSDVVNGNALQSGFRQVVQSGPAASSTPFVHELAGALVIEDQSLLAQQWPTGVQRDVLRLVTTNQHQISVLNAYPTASASERTSLLTKQITDMSRADSYNAAIRVALNHLR